MTKRVLQIIPTLDRGGAEKQLALLVAGLPRNEFDVHVCCLTRGGPLEAVLREHGIPYTVIGKRWKIDPAAYWRLRKHIQHLSPDLVHTWLFAANSYGRQAALAAGTKRIVGGERCVDRWKVWHELAIDRRLAGKTAAIVANSAAVRDFYVNHGIPGDKFRVIANGVADPAASTVTREQMLDSLSLPHDARVLVAVNRLWPQKRIKDLIWAADLLQTFRADTHLLVVGDGPQRWRLERFRQQTRTTERVHFLGQRDDVPDLLPHCDCLWLASGYEGQSNAILEAMSVGLPVIATDIPGNRDLVVPDQTGYLVPVGDRAAFARWANVLLDDPQLASRLGQGGRQRVRQCFTVDSMVQRHVDLYRELMAR